MRRRKDPEDRNHLTFERYVAIQAQRVVADPDHCQRSASGLPAVCSNMAGNEPRPKTIEMFALVGCTRQRRTPLTIRRGSVIHAL